MMTNMGLGATCLCNQDHDSYTFMQIPNIYGYGLTSTWPTTIVHAVLAELANIYAEKGTRTNTEINSAHLLQNFDTENYKEKMKYVV